MSRNRLRPRFWLAVAAALLLMIVLQIINAPLKTAASPHGIISFEFAGTAAGANAMVDSWDESARRAAALSLKLDFAFIIAYVAALGLGCRLAADFWAARRPTLAKLGGWLAWGQIVAGVLDAIENAMLWLLLHGHDCDPAAALAFAAAAVKFLLVGVGLFYALATAGIGLGNRGKR